MLSPASAFQTRFATTNRAGGPAAVFARTRYSLCRVKKGSAGGSRRRTGRRRAGSVGPPAGVRPEADPRGWALVVGFRLLCRHVPVGRGVEAAAERDRL